MKNIKVFSIVAMTLLVGVAAFVLLTSKKKSNIDEGYLIELENDYNRSISAETGDEDPFIYDNAFVNDNVTPNSSTEATTTSPIVTTYGNSVSRDYDGRATISENVSSPRTVVATASDNSASVPTVTSAAPAATTTAYVKPTSFTSQWVDTKDSKVIKDVRLMIANREYKKAQTYINRLDMNNLPGTDVGHLYQFKGIVNYFLVESDTSAFSTAIDSFQKAFDMTEVDKFKPLSILWLGMLYERYSNNQVELTQAINLFDEITAKYSNTRFANDAIFYKALVLQKLGRIEEANALAYDLQTTRYPDNLVYSKWSNDYVELSKLLPRLKS